MPIPGKLTLAQRAEIRERFLAGESAYAIAAAFGIHRSSVYGQCRDLYEPNTRKTRLTLAQQAEVQERRAQGESVPALAREFGVGHSTIYRLEKHPPVRLSCNPGTALRQRLEREYVDAATVAVELGVAKSWLWAELQAGHFLGAFRWGSEAVWIIPRAAVEVYKQRRPKEPGSGPEGT